MIVMYCASKGLCQTDDYELRVCRFYTNIELEAIEQNRWTYIVTQFGVQRSLSNLKKDSDSRVKTLHSSDQIAQCNSSAFHRELKLCCNVNVV